MGLKVLVKYWIEKQGEIVTFARLNLRHEQQPHKEFIISFEIIL